MQINAKILQLYLPEEQTTATDLEHRGLVPKLKQNQYYLHD